VLDVACGPGRFFETYQRVQSVGLDRSRGMLERFRTEKPEAMVLQGDAYRLPFAPNSFDLVLSTRFVSHLRGAYRARVLSEMARVTRDGVILDGRHCYNLRYVSRWVRRRLGLAHADKLRHTYAEFRRELGEAGLQVERVHSVAWGLSARFLIHARKR
jgi:ubiquinone/menaquinone biosynthesis C-methylase UbiE